MFIWKYLPSSRRWVDKERGEWTSAIGRRCIYDDPKLATFQLGSPLDSYFHNSKIQETSPANMTTSAYLSIKVTLASLVGGLIRQVIQHWYTVVVCRTMRKFLSARDCWLTLLLDSSLQLNRYVCQSSPSPNGVL